MSAQGDADSEELVTQEERNLGKVKTKSRPAHRVKVGEEAAGYWERQGQTGLPFYWIAAGHARGKSLKVADRISRPGV